VARLFALIILLLLHAAPADALTLVLVTGSLEFPVTSLTGRCITLGAQSAPTWRIEAPGESGGWYVSLHLSDFVSGSHVLPASLVAYQAASGSVVAVSGQAVDGANGPLESGLSGTLDASFKCLETTPGFGDGTYHWTASPARFTLTVPAQAYAGNYAATLTATLTTGP
jgi:hypothetical protein